MQRIVKISVHTSALALALALALGGCGEETPDITEAIPLDPQGSETSDGTSENAQDGSGEPLELSSGPPPLPGASDSDDGSQERTLPDTMPNTVPDTVPDTMESGANPPGMTPPPGSKVQRVN